MTDVDLSASARLIGEPARAAMLDALLAGTDLAAGDLARIAGVTPATASGHLSKLLGAGLVEVTSSGRCRYYRLGTPEVAQALEALAVISPPRRTASLRAARTSAAGAYARACYDHLAGAVGVTVHDALIRDRLLRAGEDGYELSAAGETRLAAFGVDIPAARASRRRFAFPCLDLTHRRPHLAGALGAALCRTLLDQGWLVRRRAGERALRLTEHGRPALEAAIGCRLPQQ